MIEFINKYKRISIQTKAAIWFSLCNLFIKGISFITVPLFTRIMSDEEYGTLSLFLAYEQIAMILATWEIQMGAYQKGIFKYKNNINIFTKSTLALINLLTIVFYSIIAIIHSCISQITGMSSVIIILLFIYMIVQPSYNCWLIRKRTVYEYKSAVIMTLIYSLANIFVPMLALLLINNTAEIKFESTLIISSILCLVFYVPYSNYWKLKNKITMVKEHWDFLLRFEGPLVLHSLSYLVLSQADRIMIGNMVGKAEAAYYSIAYSLASIVNLLQSSINQSLLPWRYQMLEEKEYKKIRSVTNYLLFIMMVLILLFILIAPEIMKLLFTNNYYDAVWSIPPIAASVYFMFLYTVFVNIESYFEQTKYVMYVSVTCGIVNLFLNYICIRCFGYIACGYTTLFSYILFALGHYYFMSKIISKEILGVNLFDKKFIFMLSVLLVLLSVVFTIFYQWWVIRYSFILTIIFVIFLAKKHFVSLIRKSREAS